ncbi:MAG: hypothetical protein COW48_07365 [Hydrogenophilales bacterium CG17_big_fil_post_rev_8_21_14_2_50_63_12]|nr:MAG: hypothetical protein COW48_07365 [Hydrogenophilales bacterium CG17_big_fil_post_rev_8_21_14_2_50_63_12]PIX96569.1 MAG: hypothetical protein COZ24_10015 [Hydrogenophilales bacterium CG_4_10_14_3_um_filter_63_21]
MMPAEEMQNIAAGRAHTYSILAMLYAAPPTAELAAMVRAGGLAPEGGSALSAAADALTEAFRNDAAQGLPDSDLVAEHTRLFVLPSGVVPHESYYLDDSHRLGGHATVAVQRYYEAAGTQTTSTCLELADHMGVELEFMKFLCDIERQFWQEPNPEGLQRCLDFQAGFLDGHLLRWHKTLCERVQGDTSLDIYRALARLTLEFLEAERTFVPDLTESIRSEWRTACVSES